MPVKTLVVDEQTLKKILYFYKDYEISNNNPHCLMMAKHNDTTISVFKSGKVMFQGKNALEEANIFATIQAESQNENQDPQYYLSSIGSDEVGTGDYFGPVVVCATYLPEAKISFLKTLKIDDSKKLTDDYIREIAPLLFQHLPYSILSVNNEKYNEVVPREMNNNKLKAILHQTAIKNLINKLGHKPTIVIDQFCSVNNFIQYTQDAVFVQDITFTTKAESKYLSVACASIMARYKFLLAFDQLSKQLGITLQKGASKLVDEQAAYIIERYGEEMLRKIAKLHFKNTDKLYFND